MDNVYAVIIGVLAGLASWWVVARVLTPRLAVSREISKLPATEYGPWRYRMKIVNRTWWHQPAVDIRMRASLRVYGLSGKSWSNYPIPVGHTGEMDLIERSATPRLQLHQMMAHHRRLLAEHLLKLQDNPAQLTDDQVPLLTLEQIMSVGQKAEIRFVISGAHPYTGSRRAVVGHYHTQHIWCGWFERAGLSVVRDDAKCRDTDDRPSTNA